MDKVGRNDPCPCGSGKKFKKCCGAQAQKKELKATVLPSSSFKIPSAIQSTGASLAGRVSAATGHISKPPVKGSNEPKSQNPDQSEDSLPEENE